MTISHDVPKFYWLLRLIGRLDFVRRGVRERLIRIFANPDRRLAGSFTVRMDGFVYNGNFSSFLDWNVFFFGGYERPVSAAIANFLKSHGSKSIFYDIGANVGIHSLLASRFAHLVHAFEPYPPAFEIMEQRLAENHIHNVVVHSVALGHEKSLAEFHPPADINMGAGSFVVPSSGQPIQLPIERGDDYVRERNIPLPDVIKIDTEGFDGLVLAGLTDTIKVSRPAIILETNRYVQDDIVAFGGYRNILPRDYRIFAFAGPRPILLLLSESATSYHLRSGALEIAGAEQLLLLPDELTRVN